MAEQAGYPGDSDDKWPTTLLNEIRTRHSFITDRALERMESLLNGQLSDQEVPAATLKNFAAQLIGDMVSKPIEPKEAQ